MTKVALWLRASDAGQHPENQQPPLEAFVANRGWEITQRYEVQASAYKGDHQKLLSQVYQDAGLGKFQVLLVWALDRLDRGGALATLQIVDWLGKAGVQVISLQEPWTEVAGELRELLLALTGWVARMESQRRSERTKAGLARAVSQGKTLGRPKGSKDGKRRRRSGYYRRWARE
jgi:putative DNA-invertase from lambdoid prophage Rac